MEETPYTRAVIRTARGDRRKLKEATVERDQLRAEVNRLQGYNESLLQERDSRITTVAGLRLALEGLLGGVTDRDIVAYKALARDDGKPRSYPITVTDTAIIYAATALAATPDEHERRIKAEALREFAKSRDIEVVGNGDWYAGIAAERTATVDDLRDTADRLEKGATNGR